MRVSYIIPTRNRAPWLAQTLDALGGLSEHDAEVIVIDNASDERPLIPQMLGNGLRVALVELPINRGAAARNVGADAACGDWLVMLDDDSHPTDARFVAMLGTWERSVGAVMADIHLPGRGVRESGGLPEVFIGCGVAVRRELFVELGGYDPAFDYYAEEYDLAARLIRAGMRTVFDPGFRVEHHKVDAGRDMDRILRRLVRNNGWVMQRYAPEDERRALLRETQSRYRRIAEKEKAIAGYARGLVELRETLRDQARTPMTDAEFARFTGLAAAREAVARELEAEVFAAATIVDQGKNAWAVERALIEHGVRIADDGDVLVIGTMSPGPMLDAAERLRGSGKRVVVPWVVGQESAVSRAA